MPANSNSGGDAMKLKSVSSVPLFAGPAKDDGTNKKRHQSLFQSRHPSWLALNNYPVPEDVTAKIHKKWLTRDKTGVLVMRDVTPDDKQRMIKAFKTLSAESIRKRFCCEKESLSIVELENMINCDFHHDYTVVVEAACPCEKNNIHFPKHPEGEECQEDTIVGIGQYIGLVHNEFEAEMAFLVTDQYQGQRIARRMLEHLLLQARDNGFITMRVDTQYDNLKMQHLITHNCDDTIIRRDGQDVTICVPVPGNEAELKACPSAQKMSSFLDHNENFTTRSSRRRSSVAINTKSATSSSFGSTFGASTDIKATVPSRGSRVAFYDLADVSTSGVSTIGEEMLSGGEEEHSCGSNNTNWKKSPTALHREGSPMRLDPQCAFSMHHVPQSPQSSPRSRSPSPAINRKSSSALESDDEESSMFGY
ncbi:hypothetical protein SARC_12188 [Sphaeroforma arctica JP610]|uniref:N-acetyltransferase domain-containing protein n=1 Tax=Sphaeroforma arctica JP610 TaxID=667725 RepID=A0A0L0FET7_9EUKA|nr:hypothetical protein SARC_12188 [Sphaeroforma arctica JP610]KNC75284.1 hypothetical protein SARC_12188 [Sphaeroforma arctica JP610]|eukprot:XP_014149186.1 hypothetical protein SARC_12188 [Sphaeroforma arctica JP610]